MYRTEIKKTSKSYSTALQIAESIKPKIAPYFSKLEIAGDLRLQLKEIHGIVFVGIQEVTVEKHRNLFGEIINEERTYHFHEFLMRHKVNLIMGLRDDSLSKSFMYRGLPVAVNMTEFEDAWGWHLMQNTGPSDFVNYITNIVAPKLDIVFAGKRVWQRPYVARVGHEKDASTERALFELLELDYVPPPERQQWVEAMKEKSK